MSERPSFFSELARRHVWRVAVAYAVAGWLIVQIATQVFPFFHIPDWAVRLVVILVVIGFPVAVAFAWIYELTPEGLRRTAPADSPEARPEHATRQIGRRLNALIIAVLVLAVALLGWRLLVVRRAPSARAVAARATTAAPKAQAAVAGARNSTATPVAAESGASAALPTSAAGIPEKSIAVLPFANDSGQQDQQYFSDGLSEDLINALSQFAGLKVISRNSAFQFRGSTDSSTEIGKLLGVAHLLEGSVQRAGDEVRISAQLVNAADGSIAWSAQYDKPYEDLFALQDAITHSVAGALKTKLLTTPGATAQGERPPSGNLAAWQAYQEGRFYDARNTQAATRKALGYYTTATHLDPRYAAAYARISGDWSTLAPEYPGDRTRQQAYAKARAAANTALKLAPDLAIAHLARGDLLAQAFDWTGARRDYQRAAQLAPNDPAVLVDLGSQDARFGRVTSAMTLTRRALDADPLAAGSRNLMSQYLAALGQLDAAQQAIRKAIELQPAGNIFYAQLAAIAVQRGDPKGALTAARKETDPVWRQIALTWAGQIGPDPHAADAALQDLIAKDSVVAPYQIAETYALRRDPNDMFKWLDRAWANRDIGVNSLLYDPFILRYRHDPRFAAFCRKVGLPTTTDAVAM